MPEVSIIIPCYNVEKYLRKCLDSVLSQTFCEWEAICVDDGSPDNCGEILDEYAKIDHRFKIIHQKNAGVSSARNAGLNMATGNWISFIDADDFLAADFYDKSLRTIDECTDVVQSGMQLFGQKNKKISYKKQLATKLDDILANVKKCYICNKLWRRSFLEENELKFAEDIAYCEDVLFTVTAAFCARKWKFIKYIGYFYRIHPFSVSKNLDKDELREQDKLKVLTRGLHFCNTKNVYGKSRKNLESFLIRQLIGNKNVYAELRDKQILPLFSYPDLLNNTESFWSKKFRFFRFC